MGVPRLVFPLQWQSPCALPCSRERRGTTRGKREREKDTVIERQRRRLAGAPATEEFLEIHIDRGGPNNDTSTVIFPQLSERRILSEDSSKRYDSCSTSSVSGSSRKSRPKHVEHSKAQFYLEKLQPEQLPLPNLWINSEKQSTKLFKYIVQLDLKNFLPISRKGILAYEGLGNARLRDSTVSLFLNER